MNKKDLALESLELKISYFLRYGVIFSGLVMLVGWLGRIDFHHNAFERFETYQTIPLKQELALAFAGQDWARVCSYFGLFCLISLPVIRVLLTAILFYAQKEKVLASVAALVLFALGVSFWLGGAGG